MPKEISVPMLPEADQKAANDYAEKLTKFLQENPAHRCVTILGHIMAVGNLIQAEVTEEPQRLNFYLRCVAKLADAITPERVSVDSDFMRH